MEMYTWMGIFGVVLMGVSVIAFLFLIHPDIKKIFLIRLNKWKNLRLSIGSLYHNWIAKWKDAKAVSHSFENTNLAK
ncbi:hypothetical protein LSG31_16490 [Fodinisporobacter ferrooxydans]|uniref:Uncharacterized protein n=1 Tax=Fodinisporobacter ferrooxydans TaxID=2901836 RepID=A0ABY4CJ61_9BACL|nr:hypothetical protein LSG31_16490 [Alicyclobacillaceae bacterium MYW30-H2]